jgi:hypothetical protein
LEKARDRIQSRITVMSLPNRFNLSKPTKKGVVSKRYSDIGEPDTQEAIEQGIGENGHRIRSIF